MSPNLQDVSCTSQPDDYDPQDILRDIRYHLTFVDIEDFMHTVLLIPRDWRVTYSPVFKNVLADEGFSAALKRYCWLSDIGETAEADHASFNSHALSALDVVIGTDTVPWEMKYVYRTLDTVSDKRIKDRNGIDPSIIHRRRENRVVDYNGPRTGSEETTSKKRKSAWSMPPATRQKIDSAPARGDLSLVDDDGEEAGPAAVKQPETMLQIAHRLLEKFSVSPLRSHATLGLVDRDRFQLLHTNRSTLLVSRAISLQEDLDVEMFLAILIGLRKPTLRQLGVTDIVDQHQRFLSESTSHIDNTMTLRANVPGKAPIVLTLDRVLSREPYIIGRSTTTFCATSDEWPGMKLVVKIGFPNIASGRESEETFIRTATGKAQEFSKEGEKYWVLDHLPQLLYAETAELDEIEENVRVLCTEGDYVGKKPLYDDRRRRILVYEMLYPLETLTTARDLVQVFVDITATHKWLYDHPRILHRDISKDNIMYRKGSDGTIYGVLIDFDLSSFRDDLGKVEWVQRTGTTPFMAIDLLEGLQDHYYRHDLESIFYVLLTVGSLYELRPSKTSSSSDPLLPQGLSFRSPEDEDQGVASWFRLKTSDLATRKNSFFRPWWKTKIHLTPSLECLRPWLEDVQRMFGVGFVAREVHRSKVSEYERYRRLVSDDSEENPLFRFRYPPSVPTKPPSPFNERTLDGTVRYFTFIHAARGTVKCGSGDKLRYRYNGPEYVKEDRGI